MFDKQKRGSFFSRCACCTGGEWGATGVAINRRQALRAGAAIGLGAAAARFGVAGARAQTPAAGKPQRIDVHHHYIPPVHAEAMAKHRQGGRPPKWSIAASLEEMDKNGVETAITSLVQPGVWWGDVAVGRKLARECNEYGAKMAQDHPGRFGFWAAIPLPDTEGSLHEIEYALDTLKADGIGLFSSYGDKYLGDKSFIPVFEELNRRKAVVFTHPLVPNCCKGLVPSLPAPVLEFVQDTTRAIGGVLFSGTAARFPDIRFVWCHSGGTMPFVVSRFLRLAQIRKNKFMPDGVMAELGKFYYEIAQGTMPGQLLALSKVAPTSHILFGTDYPFRPGAEAVEGLIDYHYDVADFHAIEWGNAVRLLPRLKA
jgi:predicted TIM-barrel fold metal-dependent hydrolase